MAHYAGAFSWSIFLPILLTAVLIQVGTNYANDVADFERGADTAERTGPQRLTQAGLVTPAQMKRATAIVLGLALMLGIYLVSLGGLPILIIGILSLAGAVLYTAGPYPLGYLGLGDILVFIFFGPVAVGGTFYLLTGSCPFSVLLAGAAPGCLSTAILVINNLRDIETDREAKKMTLAVRFGADFAKREYVALVFSAAACPLLLVFFWGFPLALLLSLGFLIPGVLAVRTVSMNPSSAVLNYLLAETGKLLSIYGCLFTLACLLS